MWVWHIRATNREDATCKVPHIALKRSRTRAIAADWCTSPAALRGEGGGVLGVERTVRAAALCEGRREQGKEEQGRELGHVTRACETCVCGRAPHEPCVCARARPRARARAGPPTPRGGSRACSTHVSAVPRGATRPCAMEEDTRVRRQPCRGLQALGLLGSGQARARSRPVQLRVRDSKNRIPAWLECAGVYLYHAARINGESDLVISRHCAADDNSFEFSLSFSHTHLPPKSLRSLARSFRCRTSLPRRHRCCPLMQG